MLTRARVASTPLTQAAAPSWVAPELQSRINAAYLGLSRWPLAVRDQDDAIVLETLPALTELHDFLEGYSAATYGLLWEAWGPLWSATECYLEAAEYSTKGTAQEEGPGGMRRYYFEHAQRSWDQGTQNWAEALWSWPSGRADGLILPDLPSQPQPVWPADGKADGIREAPLDTIMPVSKAHPPRPRRSRQSAEGGRAGVDAETMLLAAALPAARLTALQERRAYLLARRHGWDRDDLTRRALVAYRRAGGVVQPTVMLEAITAVAGLLYVKLRDIDGTFVVYRVQESGTLKRLRRWPRELEQ